MSINKKVLKALILAYDFPPFISVGGLRPYSWYKYFSDFDVFPVVITRQFENKYNNALDYVNEGSSSEVEIEESDKGIIIRTPYKPNLSNRLLLKYGPSRFVLIRKLITAWFEFFQWFFLVGPKKELYKAADVYLAENKVDVIIASGDPFVLFRYAGMLSKRYEVPWIADYRDPWVQDKSRKKNWLLKRFDIINEKNHVCSADLVVTVSDFLVSLISPNLSKNVFKVIPNGFDDEALAKGQRHSFDTNSLNIAFSGSVYEWHPWRLLFDAFNGLVKNNPGMKISLLFYGVNEEEEMSQYLLKKCNELKEKVHFFSRLPNDKLHEELAKAHAFLLFNDYSILGTKIFDYMALKRNILFCFSDSGISKVFRKEFHLDEYSTMCDKLQEDLINKTQSGYIVRDSNHLTEVILRIYAIFEEIGFVPCESHGVEEYARSKQVASFAKLLKEIVEKRNLKNR